MNKLLLSIAMLIFSVTVFGQTENMIEVKSTKKVYRLNTYQLSSFEIDSIEQSISNSSLVKKITERGFTYKDAARLYHPSNQIYFLKILTSNIISNEDRHQLLIHKIIYDWNRSLTDTIPHPYSESYYHDYGPMPKIDTVIINSKEEAIKDYLYNHTHPLNFSEILFVINGIPIASSHGNVNTKLAVIDKLNNLIKIQSITIPLGSSGTALYGSRAANGVILIEGKEPKINLFLLREKALRKINKTTK